MLHDQSPLLKLVEGTSTLTLDSSPNISLLAGEITLPLGRITPQDRMILGDLLIGCINNTRRRENKIIRTIYNRSVIFHTDPQEQLVLHDRFLKNYFSTIKRAIAAQFLKIPLKVIIAHTRLWRFIDVVYYTPRERSSGGYIEITLSVRLSVCPSVCLSVCLSVRLCKFVSDP